MVSTALDPVQYKVEQRKEWDAVAPGWRTWWSTIERGARALSDHMVLLAQIQTGHRVLDVATGYGEPAITAAQRVGSSGRVIGIDVSPRMLEIARDRATSHGLTHADFHEMDAEELSLPEASFDAALCRFGLMYLPDLGAALEGIKRRLVIGGYFVAAVWPTPEEAPVEALPEDAAGKLVHAPVAKPGVPGPFSLTSNHSLEQKFVQAGFNDVRSEEISIVSEFASIDDFIRYSREANATFKAMITRLSPEQQEKAYKDIIDQTQKHYQAADGKLRMPATAICVVGRR